MSEKVREMFDWVRTILQASYKNRLKIVRQIENDIRMYGSLNDEETPEGKALCESIIKSGDYEAFGLLPNLSYVRIEGTEEEREAVFIHAFGDPVILYRHKNTGVLVVLGASMHFDESLIE